jgi:DNA-binding NtrC family response regulator
MEILLISKHTSQNEMELIERILAEKKLGIRLADSYKRGLEDLARFKTPIVFLYCFDGGDDLTPAEAVRIMKEMAPNLLIVAISEETPLETERELRKSGLYFHLSSPFSEEELKDVLASVIKKETMGRKTRP